MQVTPFCQDYLGVVRKSEPRKAIFFSPLRNGFMFMVLVLTFRNIIFQNPALFISLQCVLSCIICTRNFLFLVIIEEQICIVVCFCSMTSYQLNLYSHKFLVVILMEEVILLLARILWSSDFRMRKRPNSDRSFGLYF